MRELELEYDALKESCATEGDCSCSNNLILAISHKLISVHLSLGFDTAVFDATLPTTTAIIRGQTGEERSQALAKSGKTASAGNMWRYLGHLIYNSEDMLRAREIAREMAASKRKEKADAQEERDVALLDKAEQAYHKFKEKGSLLDRLTVPDLQDIVRFLCSVKKKGAEDTFTRNNKGKKKLKERIVADAGRRRGGG